jgi:hypothetical protein
MDADMMGNMPPDAMSAMSPAQTEMLDADGNGVADMPDAAVGMEGMKGDIPDSELTWDAGDGAAAGGALDGLAPMDAGMPAGGDPMGDAMGGPPMGGAPMGDSGAPPPAFDGAMAAMDTAASANMAEGMDAANAAADADAAGAEAPADDAPADDAV